MTITQSGHGNVNQYSVNYHLMSTLLLAAKVRAPFLNGTTPGKLGTNQGTDSVKWERIENLTKVTTPLAELTGALTLPTRSGVVPSITPITAAMLKYGNTIYLTEELDLMSVNARAAKFMLALGENAGATYNELMADVYQGVSSDQTRFGNGVSTLLTIITDFVAGDIKWAENLLNRQGGAKFYADANGSTNVGSSPVRNSYMGICHVDVAVDIRDISNFISVEQYGGYTETFPFEFGAVGGVRWCETEESSLIASDAATSSVASMRGTSDTLNDVYDSYVVAMDAIGSVGLMENHTNKSYMTGEKIPAIILNQVERVASIADPQAELGALSWKGWLVGKILNDDWVTRIRTLASELE